MFHLRMHPDGSDSLLVKKLYLDLAWKKLIDRLLETLRKEDP